MQVIQTKCKALNGKRLISVKARNKTRKTYCVQIPKRINVKLQKMGDETIRHRIAFLLLSQLFLTYFSLFINFFSLRNSRLNDHFSFLFFKQFFFISISNSISLHYKNAIVFLLARGNVSFSVTAVRSFKCPAHI